jgi:hypothetical protein
MPTKQGVRLHEEPMELRPRDQPAKASKERPVLRLESRTVHLAKEDRHLVTEHDNLDGKIGLVRPLQPEDLDDPEEREVEEREGHGPFSRPPLLWQSP